MKFLEMDPEQIRTLLDQRDADGKPLYQDVLSTEVAKEQALFKHSACPKCRTYGSESFVDPKNPFIPGSPLPNRLLRCLKCQTEWNPYSGLITKISSPA